MIETGKTSLSLGTGYHLRARALGDGRVRMHNFDLNAVSFVADGRRHERFLAGEFDAAEFSLALYLALKSRGEPFMAIPVFPNRKFRHAYVFVRNDSPLRELSGLKGKKIGIPSWLNTCGLWVRGILSDEYDVRARDIHWIARRSDPFAAAVPSGIRIEKFAGEDSLALRLLHGECDAVIVPDFPVEEGVRRLLPDSKTVEQDYYRRTHIFPVSHAVVFRQSYLDRHPSAAMELYRAWGEAKKRALGDDEDATFSNFAWVRQTWEEQRALMGPDPWQYGITGNEQVLNTLIRYAEEQGLLQKNVTIPDLFLSISDY